MYPSAFKEEYAFQQSEIIVVPGRTIIIKLITVIVKLKF
jgi:hypothetical protein